MSYAFVVSGEAVFRLPDGSEHRIHPEDIEFQQVGGDERQMGDQIAYAAEYSIGGDNTPGGKWTVYEYPVGAFNHAEFEPHNGAVLERDFEYQFEDTDRSDA